MRLKFIGRVIFGIISYGLWFIGGRDRVSLRLEIGDKRALDWEGRSYFCE